MEQSIKSAILVGTIFRIAIFVYALNFPILNGRGEPVSGMILQQGIDFEFYADAADQLFSTPISQSIIKFIKFYETPFSQHQAIFLATPLLPALIVGFDYREGNTLLISLFYLGLGVTLLIFWLFWLQRMGLPKLLLLLFAILPNPIWFMLNISTDLIFAVFMAIFYLAYFSEKGETRYWIIWSISLLLLALTRPNALSLLLFVLLNQVILSWQNRSIQILGILGLAGLTLIVGLYVLPYFSAVLHGMSGENVASTFFGYKTQTYLGGIYNPLPEWLDLPFSWLTLLGAKLLYFVGLRPSFGDVAWWIVGLRGAAGLLLLPGLLWIIFRGDTKHRLLIGFFILPFILGPAQDRYNLAIQPLLFCFGYFAIRDFSGFTLRCFIRNLRRN